MWQTWEAIKTAAPVDWHVTGLNLSENVDGWEIQRTCLLVDNTRAWSAGILIGPTNTSHPEQSDGTESRSSNGESGRRNTSVYTHGGPTSQHIPVFTCNQNRFPELMHSFISVHHRINVDAELNRNLMDWRSEQMNEWLKEKGCMFEDLTVQHRNTWLYYRYSILVHNL